MSRELLQQAYQLLDNSTSEKWKLRCLIAEELKNSELKPLTDTYIQTVPDKCDRIVWRGFYHHLPIVKQRPLSDDEIEKISNHIDETANSDNGFEEWANMFARAIEKAHNIT